MDHIQTPSGTDNVQPGANPPAQSNNQPTVPRIDYEKKFGESTRENQILNDRIKVLEQEQADRNSTKEPTDSDLRAAFPLWESMSDTERDLARRTFSAERAAQTARQFTEQDRQERSWLTSIEIAITSNSALQGKEQSFRQFASRPQYHGVPMDVLVDAFLQKNGSAPTSPTPTQMSQTNPTASPTPGLEPGNGGPRTPDQPKKVTTDDLRALRLSDPKAYTEYVKTHDLDIDLDS